MEVFEGVYGALVEFYGGDAFGSGLQDGTGEAAGAGADFYDVVVCDVARVADDFIGDVLVEQEVLAERFIGAKIMGGDDFA